MVASYRSIGFLCVLLVWLTLTVSPAHSYEPLRPHLGGGLPVLDRFGDLVNYIIYAEERATVTPPPAFEIYQGNSKRSLLENVIVNPPVPNPRREQIKWNNKTMTISNTIEDPSHRTRTVHVERYSYLSWHTISKPPNTQTNPTGTGRVQANEQSQFVLDDLKFPLAGTYNLGFNATLYSGEQLRFNWTVIVDMQPQVVRLIGVPTGYNGTAFSPAPLAQLTDYAFAPVRTSTAQIELKAVEAPDGFELIGPLRVQSSSEGVVKFENVIPSLPGDYKFVFVAHLSDGTTRTSEPFGVIVTKALPVSILSLEETYGISRFQFFNQPRFQIFDTVGLIEYPDTIMTLTLGSNRPTVQYEGANTLATLYGTKVAAVDNYTYTFTDLWVDLPGDYELNVVLTLDDEVLLETTLAFKVLNAPTFDPPVLQVNTIGDITIHGDRPDTDPIYLKLSSDEECDTTVSDPVLWRRESTERDVRNISFVPYGHGDAVYVCLSLPTQTAYRPLIHYYLQSFNELYPYVLKFTIVSVDECQPLTAIQAYQYKIVGWEDASVGRSYGCKLTPPSAGTIPPCDCPFTLSCEPYSHPLFRPANLDIGQCVCCTTWVMATAGCCTTLFLLGLLSVVYLYV